MGILQYGANRQQRLAAHISKRNTCVCIHLLNQSWHYINEMWLSIILIFSLCIHWHLYTLQHFGAATLVSQFVSYTDFLNECSKSRLQVRSVLSQDQESADVTVQRARRVCSIIYSHVQPLCGYCATVTLKPCWVNCCKVIPVSWCTAGVSSQPVLAALWSLCSHAGVVNGF